MESSENMDRAQNYRTNLEPE